MFIQPLKGYNSTSNNSVDGAIYAIWSPSKALHASTVNIDITVSNRISPLQKRCNLVQYDGRMDTYMKWKCSVIILIYLKLADHMRVFVAAPSSVGYYKCVISYRWYWRCFFSFIHFIAKHSILLTQTLMSYSKTFTNKRLHRVINGCEWITWSFLQHYKNWHNH